MAQLKTVLKQVLNERDDDFGDVAFGDPNQDPDYTYPALLRLQGKTKKDSEKNTRREDSLLQALVDYVMSPGTGKTQSARLTKFLPLIQKGKKLFPSIFAPAKADGTAVYRGLPITNQEILTKLAKQTTKEDWTAEGKYMWCKKPIKYSPHSDWQSWSYDQAFAEEFAGSSILKTKQDSNFYFNYKALSIMVRLS